MAEGDPAPTYFVTGGSGYVGRNILRALVKRGHRVLALARSASSASVVEGLGAEAVRGDLADAVALREGMHGAERLIHAAANTSHGILSGDQRRDNERGTENVYRAAQQAGIRRALHVSTEAVLLDGRPLRRARETTPYPAKPAGGYSATKAAAERIALAHSSAGLEVVVLRPRFVWGRDDTTALPQLIDAARSGRLAWIGGGHYPTSTTHIDNAVHGMMLALERGGPGETYFISDGEPVEFREFVTRLLTTQGIAPPQTEVPRWIVSSLARAGDGLARITGGRLRGPMSWQEYATLGVEVTLCIDKARDDLGYAPVISIDEGMIELARA